MTAIRKAYLIAPETEFGSGEPIDGKWYVLPQGCYLSHSSSTQAQSLYGTGAKIRQNTIYGSFQGSWNASYVMDFNHLEMLSMIFDGNDNTADDTATDWDINTDNGDGTYAHTFRKYNNRRQRSYVIKERILNKIANGLYNETTLIKGALARTLQMARSTSGSQMAVEMSGVYADKLTALDDDDPTTFFQPASDPLTQYSCMYMGLDADPEDEDAIEQVDSHSIQIETAVSLVYSTCTPIATDYFEDKTTFAWNASAYMNNPTKKFKLLSNSGGTLEPKIGATNTDGQAIRSPDGTRALQPMGKNLAPLEYVNFITYADSYRDRYRSNYTSVVDAYEGSENVVRIQAINSTVKTSSTPKGDGSKLQDSLSSVECDEIIITVKNKNPTVWASGNVYAGPGSSANTDTTYFMQEFGSDSVIFPMPVKGYSGSIIANIEVKRSDEYTNFGDMDGTDGKPDLRGWVLVDPSLTSVDPETGEPVTDAPSYILDNLVPKDLYYPGSTSPSGLMVDGSSYTPSTEEEGQEMEAEGLFETVVEISGTPAVYRTDYYFMVKRYVEPAEDSFEPSRSPTIIAEPTPDYKYKTGYLKVSVRENPANPIEGTEGQDTIQLET